ncbi:MAG TPA: phosphoglycerate kinase [Phycisphaerae bacterium]|nr:phosphoglycerate kinase [Phycisphaerae bacterium]HNU45993.1 phosphoglycerate kinase [Phycisphaerae bacterium]
MKKTVADVNVRSKRVLVRLDLNVPLDKQQKITDDRRITSALPTIRRLMEGGGRLILLSHLGRPEGGPDDHKKFSLAPVAKRLTELLGKPVKLVPNCVGPEVAKAVQALRDGDVCVLENLRFHDEETIKDKNAAKDPAVREQKESFARQLAELADVYVNDAFATCHRDNASMLTVPRLMEGKPRVVGYLVQRELKFLGEAVSNPKTPFVCVLGGAKVSDKIAVIESLLGKCDTILIGGAMAYTFLAAAGVEVGKSLVERDRFEFATSLRKVAHDRLKLPVDSVAAREIAPGVASQVYEGPIPPDMMGLDIGPKTIAKFVEIIKHAKTIIWNGPMGVFETPPFDKGTLAVAQALADATAAGAVTVVGGGDSAAAIAKADLNDRVSHVSTGGGASLEFLEGKKFTAIDILDEA